MTKIIQNRTRMTMKLFQCHCKLWIKTLKFMIIANIKNLLPTDSCKAKQKRKKI